MAFIIFDDESNPLVRDVFYAVLWHCGLLFLSKLFYFHVFISYMKFFVYLCQVKTIY